LYEGCDVSVHRCEGEQPISDRPPAGARERLKIEKGDRLLVDVQDGLLILLPQPKDYTAYLTGLHKEIWADLDTDTYLREERDTWDAERRN
jgi:bifunctional DNA-binding transcriptional regulator/antitoxin component of YhaV-PrlF toxin-antitoxin module